jgi:hypothetical protein
MISGIDLRLRPGFVRLEAQAVEAVVTARQAAGFDRPSGGGVLDFGRAGGAP